jgi:peroxiredoxin
MHTAAPAWKRSPFFWFLVALSLITLGIGGWQLAAEQRGPADRTPAEPAPDFRLATSDGSTLRLSDLRGHVVLLNFWATWCPPCKAEMPDLNALQREHGAARKFIVVGVDVQESQAEVQAFARQYNIGFPLVLDSDGQVSGAYRVRTLPTSLIVDRQGFIRDRWTGQLAKAAMLRKLERVW